MNVISVSDQPDRPPSPPGRPYEQRPARVFPGLPATAAILATIALAIALTAVAGREGGPTAIGVVLLVAGNLMWGGLFVVQPNQSRVLTLFGRYLGTVTEAGWWWCNPIIKRRTVSLRVRNFQSERIKVNDARGNPIEIAAVVVWRVTDTAKAVFDVADFEQFVTVQSDTSLRHLASRFPYDDFDQAGISLRGNAGEVRDCLHAELQDRLRLAGIEILEARLTHLAYSPEIAEVMLRRQQADAILAARQTLVQGAVSLVQMAMGQLSASDLVELDAERKAAMASNLMVVLSGDRPPTPVISTGSLYT